MHAREWIVHPSPYAFNTGTDVKHRPCALSALTYSLPMPCTLPQASHIMPGHVY